MGAEPRILILGSMPGQRSLIETQYYAHRRNSFWWIMSHLVGFSENLNYQQRCKRLIAANYALWDVLYDCQRQGSLDSNILRSSEQVNNFEMFLSDAPSIKLIAFNGLAAKKIFMRYWSKLFENNSQLQWCQLPSTSPAHASLKREEKLELWRAALAPR